MSSDQIFANGRIAVLSNKLLGADKFLRLAECGSLAEAAKQLSEYGYASVDDPADCESVLRAELDKLLSDMRELCCNANALRFLLCKYDYHNAKTLMKGKYMRADMTKYCFEGATLPPSEMREAIDNDEYGGFSAIMAEACDAVDAEFADGRRSPQTVDRLLDKAYFKELKRDASASSYRLLSKLADLQINAANLSLVRRFKKASLGAEELTAWIAEGGSIGAATLVRLLEGGASHAELPEAYRGLSDGTTSLKRIRNDIVSQYADPLTLQPALRYFYAKVDETELVRRILADVKRGVDKEKIKERINANA